MHATLILYYSLQDPVSDHSVELGGDHTGLLRVEPELGGPRHRRLLLLRPVRCHGDTVLHILHLQPRPRGPEGDPLFLPAAGRVHLHSCRRPTSTRRPGLYQDHPVLDWQVWHRGRLRRSVRVHCRAVPHARAQFCPRLLLHGGPAGGHPVPVRGLAGRYQPGSPLPHHGLLLLPRWAGGPRPARDCRSTALRHRGTGG